jgi:predicted Zn-dependent protease
MQEKIIQILQDLRTYALRKGYEIDLLYHEEDSTLMRFANSAISLNTNEHIIRLDVTAYSGRRRASFNLITDLEKLDEMKSGIDSAAAMLEHTQELSYPPTIPDFTTTFHDVSGWNAGLAGLDSAGKLAYFNQVSAGLESNDIRLSGIFSSGTNIIAQISTRSEHTQYFKTSDAQITVVLAHSKLKWEITAEQSAQKLTDLNPQKLHREAGFLVGHYQSDIPRQIPLGSYDIVFGTAAAAEMVSFMNYVGFNGGSWKRGYSFLTDEQIGKKIFSYKFSLYDDPDRLETFPFKRDLMGMPRKIYPLFEHGVFQGFIWYQDDADEFGAQPTGHTVPHKSLVVLPGEKDVSSLEDLVKMPHQRDLLYIPYLHYMNIVNPSKAVITGSSRFGALLLKNDGSVVIPYNVRLTLSLLEIFGEKVGWLSKSSLPYNTSQSYGARNPTSLIVPQFLQVNDLKISHSNSSY